ncbi:MAG: methionine adenosyltransferase [Desulfobacterales bacterium]|jgi:S-adenosylmethionine synthetase
MNEFSIGLPAAERFLNDPDFKRRFPEAGEDVKVMGCRIEGLLEVTAALAFVDRYVPGSFPVC